VGALLRLGVLVAMVPWGPHLGAPRGRQPVARLPVLRGVRARRVDL
jgi:hypothetical protein